MTLLRKIFYFFVFFTLIQAETYTTKWDNINVDEILRSDRLLGNYVNCLMERGKCTAEGKELKKNLPDALQTECSKCSEKQKENTEKVIDYLMENKKNWWEELQQKFDPTGIYYKRRLMKKKSDEKKAEDSKNDKS